MKRLLVTGAGGFVGGHVVKQALTDWEVHALSGNLAPAPLAAAEWHTGDITDGVRIAALFDAIRPQAVIHCAAIANIDYSERNQDEAKRINVDVTECIAQACRRLEARLVHCSTDTVFSGAQGMYKEEDEVDPVNFYGQTKVDAERVIMAQSVDFVIGRIALVMGFPVGRDGNSFLAKWIHAWDAGKAVAVPENEIRTPIDCVSLARALVALAGRTECGVYHLAGNDCLNRYVMAQRVAKALGKSESLVTPTDSSQMKDRAPRPQDCSLDNAKARAILGPILCELEEGLHRVMAEKESES